MDSPESQDRARRLGRVVSPHIQEPTTPGTRPRDVKRLGLVLAAAVIFIAGCQALPPSEQLLAELQTRGVAAALGTAFSGTIFAADGRFICVEDESVQVHEFDDIDSAIDAAATVDRNDPSQVGNAIYEWAGTPHFWLNDRVIVLYVGDDENIEAALRNVLGQPFAEGRDPGRGVPGGGPPCERAG